MTSGPPAHHRAGDQWGRNDIIDDRPERSCMSDASGDTPCCGGGTTLERGRTAPRAARHVVPPRDWGPARSRTPPRQPDLGVLFVAALNRQATASPKDPYSGTHNLRVPVPPRPVRSVSITRANSARELAAHPSAIHTSPGPDFLRLWFRQPNQVRQTDDF